VPQFIGQRQQRLALNIGHCQPSALPREEHGSRPTNPECCARDYSGLSVEASWSMGPAATSVGAHRDIASLLVTVSIVCRLGAVWRHLQATVDSVK
jgi:hypothetical protein